MEYKIAIIIVTYNGMEWIDKCISSAMNSTIKTSIIVVDNNSTDGTTDFVKSKYPEVIFISSGKNLGFGKANNIGIEHAYKIGCEYFLLLNQDAYLREDTISKLIHTHQQNEKAGIISPIHLDGDGENIDLLFQSYLGKCGNIISDMLTKKELKDCYEIPFVNAAIWLLPKNTIEIVGGFSPYFFHYAEDNDYVNRVLYHGLKVLIVPNSFAQHDRIQEYRKENKLNWKNSYEVEVMNINKRLNISRIIVLNIGLAIKRVFRFQSPLLNLGYVIKLIKQYSHIQKIRRRIKEMGSTFLNLK